MSRGDRLRVLMTNDALTMGGAERVAVDIANTLDRDSFSVTFCPTRYGGPLESRLRDDVELVILGRAATWDVRKLPEFAEIVRSRGVDLIHSHGRGTMKFVSLARVLGLVKVPHVFHDHFGWLHVDRGASWGLRQAMVRGVDAYLGVDGRLCSWANQTVGLPEERIHLVRSGVDLDRFSGVAPVDLREAFDLPADCVVAVMAANFRPQKDHPTLFRALVRLSPEERDRLRVVVVGSTTADPQYHADCMEMRDRLGLSEVVRVVGERSDVPALLAGADAAVLTSKNETGPLVVLEYMASGLPFVATDTGEVTRQVRHLDVGFVPAPRDAADVADALSRLLALSPDERREMGERGRKVAEDRFSQRQVTGDIESIYRSLLGHGVGPGGTNPEARGAFGTGSGHT